MLNLTSYPVQENSWEWIGGDRANFNHRIITLNDAEDLDVWVESAAASSYGNEAPTMGEANE